MSAPHGLRAIVATALLGVAALLAPRDAAASDDAPAAPVRFSAWSDAARAAARTRGVPLLVYVRSDTCPSCAALDREVFAKPESGRLDAACVAVRIDSGDVPPPDAAAFMVRHDVRGYPRLLVMNADGHVVVGEAGRTVPEMLAALSRVPAEEADLAAARRAAESGDVAPLLDQLWRRMAWEEFLRLAGPRVSADPALAARAATALLRVGRTDDSRAAWRRLAETYPAHDERPEWLVRELTCGIDSAAGPRAYDGRFVPTMSALRSLAERSDERRDALVAARAWLEVARLEVAAGLDYGALVYFDKAVSSAPGSRFEPTALWERHLVQFRVRRYADAKASCEGIAKRFPASPEAKLTAAAIAKCDEMLGN